VVEPRDLGTPYRIEERDRPDHVGPEEPQRIDDGEAVVALGGEVDDMGDAAFLEHALHGGGVEGIAGRDHKQNEWRQAPVDFTVPPVRARFHMIDCVDEKGEANRLMLVDVTPSDRVHTNARDETFLRIGDETRKLNRLEAVWLH
jgi:hypothetical protein